jgi:lipid II:glycine glycyltransferase (peptidoglycan interpeptide bridge formation enzyme)
LPLSFFEGFLETGPGKILLVKFENKIIGGILCPILDQKTIYEYYVCGLDAEYPKQYPSVMATWAAIEYAMENNISQFDFMGAGSPAKKYGVRDFKLRFGGSEVENGRFIRINNRFLYLTGRLALAIKSQLRK